MSDPGPDDDHWSHDSCDNDDGDTADLCATVDHYRAATASNAALVEKLTLELSGARGAASAYKDLADMMTGARDDLAAQLAEARELLVDMVADFVSEHACVICGRCFGDEVGQHGDHEDGCQMLTAIALLKRIDGK